MKQLLSLFLFLLPCLAWAQYPSNGNQKITLGEQTSADGLIFRGVLADTGIITPSSDTSAYIILDTVNHRFYNYNRATNVWSVAGGGTSVTTFSGGTTGLTPSTATSGAVTLAGTLAVANGGTGGTSYISGAIPFSNGTSLTSDTAQLFYDATNKWLGLGTSNVSLPFTIYSQNSAMLFQTSGTGRGGQRGFYVGHTGNVSYVYNYQNFPIDFATNNLTRMTIASGGAVTINNLAGINDVGADANGKLQAATSDMNLKNTIENSPFGLNEILLLNPVTFLYNDTNRKIDSNVKEVGFIAQDVFDIIPNAVSSTATGDLQLDYRAITASLVKAIQEQQALIKALEQRIINLENK